MSAKSRIAEQIARIKAEKANIVTTLSNLGITVPSGAKLSDLPTQVNKLSTSDATAAAADVLSGKTAYVNNAKITGTIPSKAAETITPGGADQTIPSGRYLSGAQLIKGDANLIAENIKKDVSIFGVVGALVASQCGIVWGYPEVQQDPDAPLVYPVFFRNNEPTTGTTYYIKPGGNNSNDGKSWDSAWADFENCYAPFTSINGVINLYVEEGEYTINANGTDVGYSNVTLQIFGGFTTSHAWADRHPFEHPSRLVGGVLLLYGNYQLIDGLTFAYSNTYAQNALYHLGTGGHVRNCVFNGAEVTTFSTTPPIQDSNGNTGRVFDYCLFANLKSEYWIMRMNGGNNKINNCVFYNCESTRHVVRIDSGCQIVDNLFLHCKATYPGTYAIDNGGAIIVSHAALEDQRITGNYLINCIGFAESTASSDLLIVVDNYASATSANIVNDNVLINCNGGFSSRSRSREGIPGSTGNITIAVDAYRSLYYDMAGDGNYVYNCEEGTESTLGTQTNLHRENPLATVTTYTTPGRVTMTAQECLNAFVAGSFGTIERA